MRALLNLLPLLTPGQVQEAWDRLIAKKNFRDRAEALAVLVPHLPHAERAAAMPLALAAMNDARSSDPWGMDEMRGRARAFGYLLQAGTDQIGPVIQPLRTFLRELSARNFPVYELFAEFGATLPSAVTDEALECALAGHREDLVLRAIAALAPSLSPDQALRVARTFAKKTRLASASSTAALTALAARLGPGEQDIILGAAWKHACAARDLLAFRWGGPTELYALIPMLPLAERRKAVQIVINHLTPDYASWKPDGLAEALPVLTTDEVEQLYTAATKAASPASRAAAQSCILRHLGRSSPQTALAGRLSPCHTWPADLDRAAFADLIAASCHPPVAAQGRRNVSCR
jgi:hypothetical protein